MTPYDVVKSSDDTGCGVEVLFSCIEGFMLSGNSSLVCMTNGMWNGVTPQCKGVILVYIDEMVGFTFCFIVWSDVDECLEFPCNNDGTCHNTIGSFSCICTAYFLGPLCDEGTSTSGLSNCTIS